MSLKSILHIGLIFGMLTASAQTFQYRVYYDTDSMQLKEMVEINSSDSSLHGTYKSFFQNGVTKAEGFYNNNRPDSTWTYYFQNGNPKASGNLTDGKQNGRWKYFYEYGGVKSEGFLTNGIKNGEWINYYENEIVKSTGDHLNGSKDGIWNFYFEDGTLKAQAFYQSGIGKYTEFYTSGETKVTGTNTHDKSSGLWKYYYESGQLQAEGFYEEGKRHGAWTYYHENGQKSSFGAYENGSKSGEWTYWHSNGQLSGQGDLKKDKEDGIWNLYYDDGTLKSNGDYNDGTGMVSEYFPSGKLMASGEMINGNKQGDWVYYNESGDVEGRAQFESGLGDFTGYYPNDSIKVTGQLQNNRRVGEWTMYDEEGNIEGTYRPIYEEDAPVYRISEINEENSERITYDKPEYVFKAKSNRFFDPRINEYKSIIVTANPFFSAIGSLPISLEYYWQERLGYELVYELIRDPFFTSFDELQFSEVYQRGHKLKVRQKFYTPDFSVGMFYFGHELNFLWLNHNVKEVDQSTLPFTDIVVTANETAVAYGLFLGYKWMKDAGGRGFVVDAYIGVDIGYRSWTERYEPNDDYDRYFSELNQNGLYLPFEFGLMFGFSGSNHQKSSPR